MAAGKISWEQFNANNPNKRMAFEDLCRLLFKRMFFDENTIFHSESNNPGVEIEPIYSNSTKSRISYQSKYFDNTVSYPQILHSAEKTIEHYKGKIDTVYLFCNLTINRKCASFKTITTRLGNAGIDIITIDNDAILDEVIKYPLLSWPYFNTNRFTLEWLKNKFRETATIISERYNPEFNVITSTENNINLFAHTKKAVEIINAKKVSTIDDINNHRSQCSKHTGTLEKIVSHIKSIPDVCISTIEISLLWREQLLSEIKEEFEQISNLLNQKEEESKSLYEAKKYKEWHTIQDDINTLSYVLNIPNMIGLSDTECRLIKDKLLLMSGDAGIGKTQLFATTVKNILDSQNPSLLLLGTTLLSSEPFANQLIQALGINVSFDEFLDLCEEIGERHNCPTTIFIDAINESNKKQRWDIFILGLTEKLKSYNYVKIAFSLRTGYEKILFKDSLLSKIDSGELLNIKHHGFTHNSIESINSFLNYYGIAFSPVDYMQHEMTNPLFLKMFCKSYDSQNCDLVSLFDNFIKKADEEIQDNLGISISKLLPHFLDEFIEWQLNNHIQSIPLNNVLEFDFWDKYGLSNKKLDYLLLLNQNGVVLTAPREDDEIYFISYNLLENYLSARHLVNKFSDKALLVEEIKSNTMNVDDNGFVRHYYSLEMVGFICGLYSDRYGEELQEIIDCIPPYQDTVACDYIRSFTWRKPKNITKECFFDIAAKYGDADAIWSTLIINSMKSSHPLNADTLHEWLDHYTIAIRDACWTTYINGLDTDESRLYQIVEFYEKGNSFGDFSKDTIRLCLLLFSWLLTSSNRKLRDKASKAMIAILKYNFEFCIYLLEKFNAVNDPYVIERLYGIIFGACTQRQAENKEEYQKLTDYVYQTIFNQDIVYQDILLRDYARLIIERFIFEYGNNKYDVSKIMPPYSSPDIPIVKPEEYRKESTRSGFNRINHSMIPNYSGAPGMYGDFGRYTFQSALDDFENADILNLYHFAMQYIRDVLKYDDELFTQHDCSSMVRFDRGYGGTIERIGKKYQWITFHHILARISDNHNVKRWNGDVRPFSGLWDFFVRDFDPTVNIHSHYSEKPQIQWYLNDISNEFISIDATVTEVDTWRKNDCQFFSNHSQKLLSCDNQGNQWLSLYNYDEILFKKSELRRWVDPNNKGEQEIWSISQAYFVKKSDWEKLKPKLTSLNFCGRWFPEACEFNGYIGEYPWCAMYNGEDADFWKECFLKTGKTHMETFKYPSFKNSSTTDNGIIIEFDSEITREIEEEELVCKIMPAFASLSWSTENDYSKEESISFDVPCREIVEHFKLRSPNGDGYYFSPENDLVSFNAKKAEKDRCIVLRKDYLDRFLEEHDYVLFWTCIGEKQFFGRHQEWGEWSGLFYLDNNAIHGKMENKK